MDSRPEGQTLSPTSTDRQEALPVGIVTALMALYGLTYLVWERSGWGTPEIREVVGTAAFMPLNLLSGCLFLLASRKPTLDDGVRRALAIMGLGSLTVLVGNAISLYHIVALAESPTVSWADAFYLTDSFLMLASLLSFPLARRIRLEKWKFVLDAAMVLVGGAVVIWYFNVRPSAAAPGSSVTVTLLAFAYPLANLLVMLGVTTVLLRGPLDENKVAFRLLVGSVMVSMVADLTFNMVLIETGSRSAAWVDAVYLLFYLLATASGELYLRRPVARSAGREESPTRSQPLSPLPYLAASFTYGLLLAAAVRPWRDPISGLAIGAVLMTLLVVARQVVAVRQNVRLLAEQAARANEARFRSLVQNSSDVILVIKPNGMIRFVSPSVARVLRYDPAPLIGRGFIDLLDPEDRDRARTYLRDAAEHVGVMPPAEWRFRQPDGSSLHAEIIATNLLHDPTVRGIVLNTRDVSERKRLEKELLHQAFHDALTGLANRALFRDRVSHALARARRQGEPISVLYLDLDDFKKVNDSLGHAEGDRLLVMAAERFRISARAGDTVSRLGGDEFAVLIEDGAGPEGVTSVVDRLTEAMSRPFVLGGNEVKVSMSVGVATAGDDDSADDLLRNADMAMYTAKRRGKGRSETYQAHMYTDVKHRGEMEVALRAAIEGEELYLAYQPIFSLKTGRLEGIEALVRWEHPQFGHLLPQHFVPLAEETGLIVRMGRWVLREACRQVRAWRTAFPETPLTVSVNISGRQLTELDLVAETRMALAETDVAPDAVVLEITESVLMQQTGSVLEQLRALKALGVKLAIDDFGTGYSSLSYLQRFPIDLIKIARPFVEDVTAGVDKSALARAIIGLGDTLRLRTVAEGVETPEQCSALRLLGCSMGQGYYFAPPLPPAEIVRLLAQPRCELPAPAGGSFSDAA
ncbi:MAG TPA: bifunctional diguanylate cyclase/phosphodiesterase [Gemmatimonadales bacterium]|nr:bifunctional diguanylate cyclase/phosphodiesterase [Gemmatimonadales bacterium]